MQCSFPICVKSPEHHPHFSPLPQGNMENACNLFNNNGRGQSGNFTNAAFWNIWDNHHHHWNSSSTSIPTTTTTNTCNSFHHGPAASIAPVPAGNPEESERAFHALMFAQQHHGHGSIGPHFHPDPHLMCLKLGKRNYFEDTTGISKRWKPHYDGNGGGGMMVPAAAAVTVARCQVEGCHVALLNAKEYHRRHKVCEEHSKAPRVVVLGVEQRFCQQCSRFHQVTEFDDSKRSCRRRLAGHNERRRKSSHDHSVSRTHPSQGRFSYLSSATGRALSLLSSRTDTMISSPDLSSRCSAALSELIAENRAALLGRQLVTDKDWHVQHHEDLNGHQNHHQISTHYVSKVQHHVFPEPHGWDRFNGTENNNVTLDLMQAPTSEFELLSMRGKSKEEEECSQLWSSFGGGTHVI